MRKPLHVVVVICLLIMQISCSSESSAPAPASSSSSNSGGGAGIVGTFSAPPLTGNDGTVAGQTDNVVSLDINTNGCGGSSSAPNIVCASVTLCSANNISDCQTINNILVDTGSFGLRVYSSLLTIQPQPVMDDTGEYSLATCATFGDGTSMWGAVQVAYVKLGNEPAVAVPIQTIDQSYGTPAAPCTTAGGGYPALGPSDTGINGILGVGLYTEDCGAACETEADAGYYYTCNGSDCSGGALVAVDTQVKNPVSALPVDNNGVVINIGSITGHNAVSKTGSMYLGINTKTNNAVASEVSYPASGALFQTLFSEFSPSAMYAFIDSGTNVLLFPSLRSLPDCSESFGSGYAGFYCPSSTQTFSARVKGYTGTPVSSAITFYTIHAYNFISSSNRVSDGLGANSTLLGGTPIFDWGLPFFFGRKVFVGFESNTATQTPTLGAGPFWAF